MRPTELLEKNFFIQTVSQLSFCTLVLYSQVYLGEQGRIHQSKQRHLYINKFRFYSSYSSLFILFKVRGLTSVSCIVPLHELLGNTSTDSNSQKSGEVDPSPAVYRQGTKVMLIQRTHRDKQKLEPKLSKSVF